MIQLLISGLRRVPSWPMVGLLFVAFLLCDFAFGWRSDQLFSPNKVLDARGWYSPDEAKVLFERLGDEGRWLYAKTEVTLDLAFPLIYGTLFLLLTLRLYHESVAKRLMLVPLIAMVADLLENSLIAYLAWTFDGQASALTWLAAIFTAVKTAAFVGALLVILAGGIKGVLAR
ncbi:MAG: hypothetical protein PVJ39_21905 [Gammaproteobacteria bacterium]|jgi:hypothetical protein